MTLSTPKSELTSARMFDGKTADEVAYWIDTDVAAMDGQPGKNNHVAACRSAAERLIAFQAAAINILSYVDKTLDNVAHVDTDVTWKNSEVVGMLDDLRSVIVTGGVTPGTLADVEVGGRRGR